MDDSAVKELCHRLDELAAILDIMEGEQINVDLHREASAALRDALGEIERLRSDAGLHRETFTALGDAVSPTDWVMKFLARKRALTGRG